MKIVISSDHAGFELKEFLKGKISGLTDLGTNSLESVDYPDFGFKAADAVATKQADLGIVICGSGIGISIATNRNKAVRCALCRTPEEAKLAREHNNANMLALGARITEPKLALDIVQTFLSTAFEGGRHEKRVQKLSNC